MECDNRRWRKQMRQYRLQRLKMFFLKLLRPTSLMFVAFDEGIYEFSIAYNVRMKTPKNIRLRMISPQNEIMEINLSQLVFAMMDRTDYRQRQNAYSESLLKKAS